VQLADKLVLYAKSPEVKALQDGIQAALDALWAAGDDSIDGAFVATASASLDLWERAYGIETDISLTDAHRRENVIAAMRSAGTTTVDMIKAVAESYANGEVAVTEQYADYRFTITFISTRGVPAQMDALKRAIERIKPAHLAVIYVFSYVTHGDIKAAGYTHGQLAGYTHEAIRNSLEV
jgi:uncharacterized protein YmfQ (DUF2313 family)